MPSPKQGKQGRLAEDIRRTLIDIIGELKDPRLEEGLLTVTRVEATPDLDLAKVYISVLGKEGAAKEAVETLNHAAGHVRTEISKRMHIRKAPALRFIEDDSAAYATHINSLLKEIQNG